MSARILIAEDHADSMTLMRYLLEAHGYVALCAEDGDRAIALARSERPDLIVCDLQMPGLNGYEIVELLKQDADLYAIPRVAVTAFSMLGDREAVLAAGFDGYFSKPIQAARFVTELEQFLPPALHAPRCRGKADQTDPGP